MVKDKSGNWTKGYSQHCEYNLSHKSFSCNRGNIMLGRVCISCGSLKGIWSLYFPGKHLANRTDKRDARIAFILHLFWTLMQSPIMEEKVTSKAIADKSYRLWPYQADNTFARQRYQIRHHRSGYNLFIEIHPETKEAILLTILNEKDSNEGRVRDKLWNFVIDISAPDAEKNCNVTIKSWELFKEPTPDWKDGKWNVITSFPVPRMSVEPHKKDADLFKELAEKIK